MNLYDASAGDIAPLLLRPIDAAKSLAISPRKLWELTNRGDIRAVRDGRLVRYDIADLRRWVESRKGERR